MTIIDPHSGRSIHSFREKTYTLPPPMVLSVTSRIVTVVIILFRQEQFPHPCQVLSTTWFRNVKFFEQLLIFALNQ